MGDDEMTTKFINWATQLDLTEGIYAVQTIISFAALLISIITLIFTVIIQNKQLTIQKKTIENSIKQARFATLVSLYQLGKSFTSNLCGFDQEIQELIYQIENQIHPEDFYAIYQESKYDKLREAITYFDFIQNMIRDKSLRHEECYGIVTFPIKLYKNLLPLIKYGEKNKIHSFDRFDEFCREYLNYMSNSN